MTITITLPPATEVLLRAQSEATGKDMAAIVVEAVEARLTLAHLSLRGILAPVHEDFRKSGMTAEDLDRLLEEAISDVRAERTYESGAAK